MTRKTQHISSLQSARGLAAVVVLLHHCAYYFQTTDAFAGTMEALLNAHAAVVTFFVLSGLVLTRSLNAKSMTVGNVLKFYHQRLWRIYPAIFAACALSILYLTYFHYKASPRDTSLWYEGFYPSDHFTAKYIVASLAGIGTFLIPPLWSICVELVASVFMPLFAYIVSRGARWTATAFAVLALVAITSGEDMRFGLGVYLPAFILGGSIPLWSRRIRSLSIEAASILCALALGVLTFFRQLGGWNFVDHYNAPIPALVEAIAATALIALLFEFGNRMAILNSPPLVRLGDISYSLYLIHFPLMSFMGGVISYFIAPMSSFDHVDVKAVILMASTLVVAVPIAAVLYQFIELPGIRLGRYMLQRTRQLGEDAAALK